ncbi:MAG: lytic transglycosylase domain-containing protein [Acidobacteria bacterium]|nr:lytic transglycosylase domain-containing protein [Acidobacteriota bacterium]
MTAVLGTAALAVAGAPAGKSTSTVRADARTGRLVRTVVITPRAGNGVAAEASRLTGNGRSELKAIVEETAGRHAVDPLLVDSVIQVESGYNALAVSDKGAEGLMQLIPATARRFGVKNSFDPRENIEGGVRYLKYLKEAFQDDRLALAAYNAGEGAVAKYGWIPPYPETQNYVYQVGKRYGEAKKSSGAARSAGQQPAAKSGQPVYRPIEQFIDAEGRLHIRTR